MQASRRLTALKQGRGKEAEDQEAQVMETRKKVLGHERPDTLTSYRNQGGRGVGGASDGDKKEGARTGIA
jgi:hypothetical protein